MSGVGTHGPAAVSAPKAAQAAPAHPPKGRLLALTLGATGIVFGDIGTSPLYALNQVFFGRAELLPTSQTVLGGLSLVIWTLIVVVAIKYALLVMRADQDGEGGIFALYGLLHPYKRRGAQLLLWSLMLGGGLLFGDGFITPAISVLSAVEGLKVAAPEVADTVIPITVLLLTALFAFQFKGTAKSPACSARWCSSGSRRSRCSAPHRSPKSPAFSPPSTRSTASASSGMPARTKACSSSAR